MPAIAKILRNRTPGGSIDDVEGTSDQAEPRTGHADMVQAGLWITIGSALALPGNVVIGLLLAGHLGAREFGRYAGVVSAWALVGLLINLGLSAATVQWLASDWAAGNDDGALEHVRHSSGFHVFLQAPIQAVAIFLLLTGEPLTTRLLASGLVALIAVLGTSLVVLTATGMNAVQARISVAGSAATALLTLGIVTTTDLDGPTTWCVLQVITVVIGFLAVSRLPSDFRRAMVRPSLRGAWGSGFWRFALFTGISSLGSSVVFGRAEVLVLNGNGLAAAAGQFALAAALAGAVSVPMDSLTGALGPAAIHAFAISAERAVSLLVRSLRLTAVLGALTACGLAPFIALVGPHLVGDDFASPRHVVITLMLASVLQSVLSPLNAFVFAARLTGVPLLVVVASAGLDAALALTLIPVIGLTGAVAASLGGQVLHVVGMSMYAARRLPVDTLTIVRATSPFLFGASIGVATVLGSGALPVAWAGRGLLSSAVGLAVYLGATRILDLGGPSLSDLQSLHDKMPSRLWPAHRAFWRLVTGLALERPQLS